MHAISKDLESIESFVFPFEGEKHLCTCIFLPFRKDTWRENAAPALKEYLEVAKAISVYERVVVIAHPDIPYETVKRFEIPNSHILRLRYDDAWARDSLPVFLKSKDRLVGVDFGFNAWGGEVCGLYDDWKDDNEVGKYALLDLMIERYADKDFILEGGSIHTDGEGTLLVTEECLLSKSRNPSMTKEEIEERLKKDLNVEKVIWIPYGVYNDETSGHVDNICCYIKPGTVLLGWCDDTEDPQYERSKADLEYLESVTDAKGRKLEVIRMPLPKPQYMTKEECAGIQAADTAIARLEGRRLAASYVNFYMGQEFVLLPQFGVEEDKIAFDLMSEIYKGQKKIIPIRSREILLGGGNIHCITKQIPYMKNYPIEPEDEEE